MERIESPTLVVVARSEQINRVRPPFGVQPLEESWGKHPIIRDEELRELIRECILLSRHPLDRNSNPMGITKPKEVLRQSVKRDPSAPPINDTLEVHRVHLEEHHLPTAKMREGLKAPKNS
jgi:hypothetical protein